MTSNTVIGVSDATNFTTQPYELICQLLNTKQKSNQLVMRYQSHSLFGQFVNFL